MPLIVPGVARFAVNQTLEGRAVVNVLDYKIDTTGSTMSRATAVNTQAGSILREWALNVLDDQADDLTLDSVTYVDLDSATGVTGKVTSHGGTVAPVAGGTTGSPLPANTAALVTKQVVSARGRRSGRLYLSGMVEPATQVANGNLLEAANVASINTSFANFLAATNELDTLGTAFSSKMQVVSVTARDSSGNPSAGVSAEVTAMTCQSLLATQRRRLRG